ncbi:hypothetical protein RR42_s0230 [Cupriavidus basilensis]|uniref:Uncharacterized protein n=1 Tax=Cupriavidus basilensis TaxID=68895 RepID=A0A0C4YML0_9BURK|nr:hypothetical protein RR42_s0230 [Cupriavidus basilensis]
MIQRRHECLGNPVASILHWDGVPARLVRWPTHPVLLQAGSGTARFACRAACVYHASKGKPGYRADVPERNRGEAGTFWRITWKSTARASGAQRRQP